MIRTDIVPAIIISRCIGDDSEFDTIAEGRPEIYGKGQKPDIRNQNDTYYEARWNLEQQIAWFNGVTLKRNTAFREVCSEALDPHKNGNISENDLSEFFEELLGHLQSFGFTIRDKLIIVIHLGGDVNDDVYKKLRQYFDKAFKKLYRGLILRLTTSGNSSQNSSDIVPHSLWGLAETGSITNSLQIREHLNSLLLASHSGGYQSLDREIRNLLLTDLTAVTNELDSSFPEFILPGYPDLKADLLKVLNYPAKDYTIGSCKFSFYVAHKQENENKIILKEVPIQRSVISRIVRNRCHAFLNVNCSFVYLGLDVLSSANYNAYYEFDKNSRIPLIFVTLFDIVKLASAENLNSLKDSEKSAVKSLISHIDGRFRFFDSSIWFRSLPLFSDMDQINHVMGMIKENEAMRIYQTSQASESRDLLIRTFNQSYVQKNVDMPSHGQLVTPWMFHSEYYMLGRVTKLIENNKEKFKKLGWNLYIVDDHATEYLDGTSYSKTDLIQGLINKFIRKEKKNETEETEILWPEVHMMQPAVTVSEAKTYLRMVSRSGSQYEKKENSWPDIVLLDYLIKDNIRNEFGDEIVKDVIQSKEDYKEMGPLNKLWFYPISVYTNTIQNKLHEGGTSMYSENCIVVAGADPITAPYLFIHNLFSIFKRQADELVNPGLTKAHSLQCSTLEEYLNLLCEGVSDDGAGLKNNAITHFPSIVAAAVTYEGIRNSTHISRLSKKIQTEYFHEMETYEIEHFRDVVYLLAYGGMADKDKLWGEWAISKDIILKLMNRSKSKEKKKSEETNMIALHIIKIENYISSL